MNIWALKKDVRIKRLLLMLQEAFDPGAFEILDDPTVDPRAARLGNPGLTDTFLYIYTYGQENGRYGIDIEYPNLEETNTYDTIESLENATLAELMTILITKLEIPPEMLLTDDHR